MNQHIRMRMQNKGAGEFRADGGTLWLYDVIASDDNEAEWFGGVSPRQFIAALAATTGPVTIRVNSPGGSVFGAQAMVAAMRAHQEAITVQVDSLAASAASVIACEATQLTMAPGAMMMIHKAWGMVIGNEADMRGTADLLAKIDGQIAETYARRSGGSAESFLAMMAEETWFTAQEAVSAGLADAILTENNQRPQARWDLSAYAKAPSFSAESDAQKESKPFNDADEKFVRDMIPHHSSAVAMAKEVIADGINDDVAAMAGAIIAAQIEEIEQLQEWLAEQGLSADSGSPAMRAISDRQRRLAARLVAHEI